MQELRSNLGPKGVLYKDFSSLKEFRDSLFRSFGVIISSHLNEFQGGIFNKTALEKNVTTSDSFNVDGSDSESENSDELGLIDLNELQQEFMEMSSSALHNISYSMNELSSFIEEKTNLIEKYNSSGDQGSAKKVFVDVANKMSSFSDVIDKNAPIVGEAFGVASQHLRALVEISLSDFSTPNDKDEISSLRSIIEDVLNAAVEGRDSIVGYGESVLRMPRITKEMNAARRKLASSNENYLLVMNKVIDDIISLVAFLDASEAR